MTNAKAKVLYTSAKVNGWEILKMGNLMGKVCLSQVVVKKLKVCGKMEFLGIDILDIIYKLKNMYSLFGYLRNKPVSEIS